MALHLRYSNPIPVSKIHSKPHKQINATQGLPIHRNRVDATMLPDEFLCYYRNTEQLVQSVQWNDWQMWSGSTPSPSRYCQGKLSSACYLPAFLLTLSQPGELNGQEPLCWSTDFRALRVENRGSIIFCSCSLCYIGLSILINLQLTSDKDGVKV